MKTLLISTVLAVLGATHAFAQDGNYSLWQSGNEDAIVSIDVSEDVLALATTHSDISRIEFVTSDDGEILIFDQDEEQVAILKNPGQSYTSGNIKVTYARRITRDPADNEAVCLGSEKGAELQNLPFKVTKPTIAISAPSLTKDVLYIGLGGQVSTNAYQCTDNY
ncbi:MAG: hypothetical protein KDK51_07655 [Deltaproteobacteria bacterium]|nr:hypothetical protein [Deltaproteobacteria bacterium]